MEGSPDNKIGQPDFNKQTMFSARNAGGMFR